MPERKDRPQTAPSVAGLKSYVIYAFYALSILLASSACSVPRSRAVSVTPPSARPVLNGLAETAEVTGSAQPARPAQQASQASPVYVSQASQASPVYVSQASQASPVYVSPEQVSSEQTSSEQTSSEQASPEQASPAPLQSAGEPLRSYEPNLLAAGADLWSGSFTFADGLIDQRRLVEPLAGSWSTAQAGGRLLSAYGLRSLEDESASEARPRFEETAAYASAGLSPASGSLDVGSSDAGSSDAGALGADLSAYPAPSAGAAETVLVLGAGTAAPSSGLLKKTRTEAAMTEELLTRAYAQTGRRYLSGGANPAAGFDDVGYVNWLFARQGLNLPKTPSALAKAGAEVSRDDLRPGDVLVYRQAGEGWHVGLYSGRGNFLHASPKAGVVTETDAFGPQYAPYFLSARRFYDDPEAAPLSETRKMSAASAAVKTALAELGPNDRVIKPAPRPAPKSPAKKAKAKR